MKDKNQLTKWLQIKQFKEILHILPLTPRQQIKICCKEKHYSKSTRRIFYALFYLSENLPS